MKAVKTPRLTKDTIYNELKRSILSGEHNPGERLSESSLATKFSTSRTPVREAFQKLAENGLVFIHPNRFVEIASYSETEDTQLGIIRIQLDILSARLAIHYGSNADFLQLKEIATECYDIACQGDISKAISLDSDFHLFLTKISQNEFLYDTQKNLWLKSQFMLSTKHFDIEEYSKRVKLHFDIVEAFLERDESKVISKIKEHLLERYHLTDDIPPMLIEKL